VGLSGALLAGLLAPSGASSHREAPLTSQDPTADHTDVFAFKTPDAPGMVTLVANVNPFEDPAGGPNFYKFGDEVLYRINIDNDGDAIPDVRYEWDFRTQTPNPNTFLYNTNQVTSLTDPDLSVFQSYTLRKYEGSTKTTIAEGHKVPPANVGAQRSTPDYEANLGRAGVYGIPGGGKVFAGPRDDPFFVDLGSIFDLGGLRPFNQNHLIPLPNEEGEDYVAGYNVLTMAIQVPIAELTEGDEPVLGVYATALRRRERIHAGDRSGGISTSGPWVEVSRLGNPLINEVVVPMGAKDRFNASRPRDDAQFLPQVIDPELGRLIPVLYPGVEVPTEVPVPGVNLGGREDIATIFLTGIAGINQPANVKPSEMLRINTATDTGFPNGRALPDDVADIEIQALAAASALGPKANTAPNNQLGDGVDANDRSFLDRFPYLAPPRDGYGS